MKLKRYDPVQTLWDGSTCNGDVEERDDGDFVRVDDLVEWLDQAIKHYTNLSIRKKEESKISTALFCHGACEALKKIKREIVADALAMTSQSIARGHSRTD